MKPIGVVPFGKVSEIASKAIAARILGYLHISVDIARPLAHPGYAYDQGRLQYDAGDILKAFESIPFHDYEKVIGLLDVDLFVPILSYVFGEARQGGKCALVSMHRLNRDCDGSTPTSPLLLERLGKVALHELGHLFNLVHCEDKRCLMHFSGGIQALDRTASYFCRYCTIYLREALQVMKRKDLDSTDGNHL
jgi:archaemetzincin